MVILLLWMAAYVVCFRIARNISFESEPPAGWAVVADVVCILAMMAFTWFAFLQILIFGGVFAFAWQTGVWV